MDKIEKIDDFIQFVENERWQIYSDMSEESPAAIFVNKRLLYFLNANKEFNLTKFYIKKGPYALLNMCLDHLFMIDHSGRGWEGIFNNTVDNMTDLLIKEMLHIVDIHMKSLPKDKFRTDLALYGKYEMFFSADEMTQIIHLCNLAAFNSILFVNGYEMCSDLQEIDDISEEIFYPFYNRHKEILTFNVHGKLN